MKVDIFDVTEKNLKRFDKVLCDNQLNVKKIIVASHERTPDTIYATIEVVEETLRKEREALETAKASAKGIVKDEVYGHLKNQKQRVMYLCDKYEISKAEAENAIEWLGVMKVKENL